MPKRGDGVPTYKSKSKRAAATEEAKHTASSPHFVDAGSRGGARDTSGSRSLPKGFLEDASPAASGSSRSLPRGFLDDAPPCASSSPPPPAENINVTSEGLLDETLERVGGVPGVLGAVVFDREGGVLRTTLGALEATRTAAAGAVLLERARGCVDQDDALSLFCVRTKKHELLLSTEKDGKYGIAVLQNPYQSDA